MCYSRFVVPILSVLIVTSFMGCGQKTGSSRKKKASGSTGGELTTRPPTAGMDSVVKTTAGHFRVDFLGFGQSSDAKQRVLRLVLRNGTKKTVRSARVVLRYASESGKPLGEFRQHVVRPIAPGASVEEPTDLMGQQGPPEEVRQVTVRVDEVEYTDGTRWKRSPK